MKKHLFALASAALASTAAFALGADAPPATGMAPVAGPTSTVITSTVVGHASATDGATQSATDGATHVVGEYLGDGQKGCGGCDPCRRCVWVYAEYLNWWTRGDDTPTLLGTATTTPNGIAVAPLFGNSVSDDPRQGFRAGGGFYPHCKRSNVGVEANFFSLGNHSDAATFTGTAGTVLAQPFINAATGLPTAFILGGGTTGTGAEATLRHDSRLWGGNIGLRTKLAGNGGCSGGCGDGGDCGGASCTRCLELQAGYQYYALNEVMSIRTRQNTARSVVDVAEDFETNNSYHGGYLGLVGEYNCGKWFIGGNARGGVGDVRQIARIGGTTTTTIGGVATTSQTGQVFAQTSNRGTRLDNDFTWAGEAGVKLGVQPLCWLRAWIGYDFLYIHDVNRPGGVIDPVVNRAQLNGFGADPFAPNNNPRRDAFWAHGLNVGAELKF